METIKFRNFSETHPELRDGEVWFANMRLNEANIFELNTKRIGEVAYDFQGNKLQGLVPVFMTHEEEYIKKFERK